MNADYNYDSNCNLINNSNNTTNNINNITATSKNNNNVLMKNKKDTTARRLGTEVCSQALQALFSLCKVSNTSIELEKQLLKLIFLLFFKKRVLGFLLPHKLITYSISLSIIFLIMLIIFFTH